MLNIMRNPASTEAILENRLQDKHSYVASSPIIRVDLSESNPRQLRLGYPPPRKNSSHFKEQTEGQVTKSDSLLHTVSCK